MDKLLLPVGLIDAFEAARAAFNSHVYSLLIQIRIRVLFQTGCQRKSDRNFKLRYNNKKKETVLPKSLI